MAKNIKYEISAEIADALACRSLSEHLSFLKSDQKSLKKKITNGLGGEREYGDNIRTISAIETVLKYYGHEVHK